MVKLKTHKSHIYLLSPFNRIFSIFLLFLFSTKFLFNNGECTNGEPYKLLDNCVSNCSIEQLIEEKTCIPVSLSEDHINEMYDIIESYIINKDTEQFDNDIIIEGEKITYQITTNYLIENQSIEKNKIYLNLGEQCIQNIKDLNDDFFIILTNIINTNYTTSTEGIKIISLKTELSINLLCGGETIIYGIPVLVPEETITIYNKLMESYNYDILNLNSSFYIDICEIYTTEDNTDMSLTQRIEIFGSHGIDICAKNCKYKKFVIEESKIYCECYIETGDEDDEEKRNIGQQIYDKLAEFLDLINFDVMLCVKLVYSLGGKGLLKNYGFMIMTLFSFLYILSMIIAFFIFNKKITKIVSDFTQLKIKFNNLLQEEINKNENNIENINIDSKKSNVPILKLNEDEENEEEEEEGEEEEDDEEEGEELEDNEDNKEIKNEKKVNKEEKKEEKKIDNKNINEEIKKEKEKKEKKNENKTKGENRKKTELNKDTEKTMPTKHEKDENKNSNYNISPHNRDNNNNNNYLINMNSPQQFPQNNIYNPNLPNQSNQNNNINNLKDNDVIKIVIPYDKVLENNKKEKKKIKKKIKKKKNLNKNNLDTKNEKKSLDEKDKNLQQNKNENNPENNKDKENNIQNNKKIIKKKKKKKKVKKVIRYEIKLVDDEKSNPPKKKRLAFNKNNGLESSKIKELNNNHFEDSRKDENSLHHLRENKKKINHKNKKNKTNKKKNKITIYNKNNYNENEITDENNNSLENDDKINDLNNQELEIKFGTLEFFQSLMKIQEDKRKDFLIDEELNGLEYQYAIELDKRSYCELYFSLLKKQNILIFCLSYCLNDYNLSIMKFSFLMFQFIIFITVSAFFFTDNTLNNIYENKNKFDFLFMARQLILTFLINLGVNLIFKILMRTDNKIIEIKQENENFNDGLNSIKCKFIFYFVFGVIILMFGWFYISCFCAVLSHTQIILIECAAYSLLITFIYPFFFCLLSPSFRICALNSSKKDKKCLYEFSKILAFI